MSLPVRPPVAPMLAKLSRSLPAGDWWYEPKWDGFRCIVFRDGDDVELTSRNERPLTVYFPEVVEAVKGELPPACVVDGEIVVAGPGGLDFDALSQRIHPAASRITRLSVETPAAFVAFDLLAVGDEDLRRAPFSERRRRLEAAIPADRDSPPGTGVHVTPLTTEAAVAADWFTRFEGAGLDGVVAKRPGSPYAEGERTMMKVKHERTAEFVVAGFRWYRSGPPGGAVGSLLLGLYEGDELQHVGVIGSFPAAQRRELVGTLAPLRDVSDHPWSDWAEMAGSAAGEGRAGPRAGNRWNADADLSFELLRPELVVEAAYEHLQGRRLRHGARFRRFRPDRDPRSCTYDQIEVAAPALLADVLGART